MITANNVDVQLGNRAALSGVSFQIERGDFMAILGPNGGGKSTLLRTILGLVPTSGGTLKIDAQSSGLHRPGIGYVPQVKSLDRSFPARAIELVSTSVIGRWPHRISKTDRLTCESALEKVGALHLAEQSIRSLSGGELQRVFLAKAIIREPAILLLDEPESGIDLSGTKDLYTLLEGLHRRLHTCILMVTHDWDVAFHHATHVLLLNTEQLGFGSPDAALSESAIRNAFGHVGHKHGTLTGVDQTHSEHVHE